MPECWSQAGIKSITSSKWLLELHGPGISSWLCPSALRSVWNRHIHIYIHLHMAPITYQLHMAPITHAEDTVPLCVWLNARFFSMISWVLIVDTNISDMTQEVSGLLQKPNLVHGLEWCDCRLQVIVCSCRAYPQHTLCSFLSSLLAIGKRVAISCAVNPPSNLWLCTAVNPLQRCQCEWTFYVWFLHAFDGTSTNLQITNSNLACSKTSRRFNSRP